MFNVEYKYKGSVVLVGILYRKQGKRKCGRGIKKFKIIFLQLFDKFKNVFPHLMLNCTQITPKYFIKVLRLLIF